ncbi:MAG TPA: secretin N-terminal domain-containing protein [Planctomycetota bacterium]|nr:secretin N-terminal domain-containing protein [Planctomycetota bacterium]
MGGWRMRVHGAVLLGILALSGAARGAPQDAPADRDLVFNFKDASVDAVLQYVSSVTGWIFVQEKRISGTIDAVSAAKVPVSKCLDFLNAALRRHGAIIPNPYSPGLPKPGQVLKVVDMDEAKRRAIEIHSGADPDDIPVTDQVRTQILPLKAVNVQDVSKELGEMLKAAVAPDGQVSYSTYSNSVVITGRSDGINRIARVLRVIDVSASAELKIRVFPLKNADSADTAKILNEVFKRESMRAETGRQDPFSNMMRMFGGGDRGRGADGASVQPKALASEMVRITAEPRTNSIIVSATDDNMKIIEDLIKRLDERGAGAVKLKLYPLRFADATTAAKTIADLFGESGSSGGRGASNANNSNNGRNRGPWPVWMGQAMQAPSDPLSAGNEVRAVADVRTNSVMVAASEAKLLVIDDLVRELDRQVNDLLEVKIYRLQNADAAQMATILQSLFRPQVQATSNAGRAQGSGGNMRFNTQGGSSPLLPSQEVEITSDVRTRSVIVKASREYIAIMDDVVKQLDEDPTETTSTYVVPLRNADATNLAATLQTLLKGQSGAGSSLQNRFGTTGTMTNGLFGGMQQNPGQYGTMNGASRGSFGSTRSSSSSRGRLGPLDGAQEEPAAPPQEEDPRRGIEGQADIAPDPTTNSLVIRTSPRNFRAIQGILQDLDRMRPQVLIKVLIADVTLDERTQFGVEGFWENKMSVRGGDAARNRVATDFALASQGFTYLLQGDEFQATLNLFAQEGKLKVLATPRILVLDNQTATINVGQEFPRVTNTIINDLGNPVNTVQYEDIGIILEVTPHINPDGLVTMIVSPEISDVASRSEWVEITPGVLSPAFTVNRATTSVSVRTGTTVAIGGLIRESVDDTVQKIPLLGDIPLLGNLFSNTTQRKVKRELMIFLTPYVAFSAAELEEITQVEKSRLKVMDVRDIESESDRWLERVRR